MPRRAAPLEARLTPMERFAIGNALSFGPWKAEAADGGPFGDRRFSDSELAGHWEWAKLEPPPGHSGIWDETTWAYRVFELGERPEVAFRRCRRLQWKKLDRVTELGQKRAGRKI